MIYAEAARKVRLPLGFVLGALFLFFAHPTPLSLATGGAVAFVGILVRAWASGHITKNERLAVTGPYAHTRNPLYFGSFLIGAGFAMVAHWALLLVVVAFWVLVYAPTMEREKANISGRFPEAYARYSENVPAFVPRVTPWREESSDDGAFSLDLYMRHGEWKALLTYLAVMAWLALRMS